MKAIVKQYPKEGLWLQDVPCPKPGPNEVLIKVRKAAICGTDLHIYQWDSWAQKTLKTPLVIGHEFMGEVAELGSAVHSLKVGQRVSGEGHITCGKCRNCRTGTQHLCAHTQGTGIQRHGCFAEFFTLPAENVYPLSDAIDDELGAICDPFGNAVHTALSFDLVGEDILITGAGPIGLMAAAVAKRCGARNVVITDINPHRLQLAKKLGCCTAALDANDLNLKKELHALGINDGIAVGMEMSGSPAALADMLDAMQPNGKVALLGILAPSTKVDWDLIVFKGLHLKGIYGREMFRTWDQMQRLLEGGLDIGGIITHHYPYEEFEKGFAAMATGESGKVILEWS